MVKTFHSSLLSRRQSALLGVLKRRVQIRAQLWWNDHGVLTEGIRRHAINPWCLQESSCYWCIGIHVMFFGLRSPRRERVLTIPALRPWDVKWNTTCSCKSCSHVDCRLQLKFDGTRWCTGGEVKGKLANGVGSQYPSHYFGTWCIRHYYRWCAHLGCQ